MATITTSRVEKERLLETISMPSIAGPTRTNIPITEVIRKLKLCLSGTMTEGGTAGGTLANEAMLSLIRAITIIGTSSKRTEIGKIKFADFAAFYRLQHFLKGVEGHYLDPTPITKSAAASPFYANLNIDFEMPWSQDPRQTLLNTTELTSLSMLVDWGDASDVITGGAWTFPTCSLEVYADEFVDDGTKAHKFGINQFSYLEQSTTSSNTRLAIDLKRGYLHRGIMIKQFTRTAYGHVPVETVVNSYSFELNREIKKTGSWAVLQASNKERYGLANVPKGYAFIDFMPEKRYDTLVDSRKYRDVNLVLNVNAVPNSFVRIYPVEIIPAF
jgi:hypothetical protein